MFQLLFVLQRTPRSGEDWRISERTTHVNESLPGVEPSGHHGME